MNKHYERAIQYLSQFYNRTINRKEKHHLHIMNEILDLFSINLEDFEFIQIAGSCGKGSTAFLLSNMLNENEIKHGLFTGPHLIHYEERFRVNHEQIDSEEFSRIVLDIAEKLKNYLRFSEVGHMHLMVLIALLFFKHHQIRLVIFENGVGGASDPTNIFSPIIAVLTEITLDHCHLLGGTIEEITENKLQIIKETTQYAVCGMKNPTARILLKKKGKMTNPRYIFYQQDYYSSNEKSSLHSNLFDYHGMDRVLKQLSLPLIGEHQIQNTTNALVVMECLTNLGYRIQWEKVRKGIEKLSIPCRMERVQRNGLTFLFDGAHNSLELKTLKQNIHALQIDVSKILMTISSNKNVQEMIHSIYLKDAEILLVPNPFIERRISLEEITSYLDRQKLVNYRTFENIESALQYLYQDVGHQNQTVLVTGSLYLVGKIKNIVF